MSDFGAALKAMRLRTGWVSQSGLAERAGFDHSYVSRLESGARTPTRDAVERLATALHVEPDDRERLLRSAGFIGDDDSEMVRAIRADAEVSGLWDVLNDPDVPTEYRENMRTVVRLLVAQVREHSALLRKVAA